MRGVPVRAWLFVVGVMVSAEGPRTEGAWSTACREGEAELCVATYLALRDPLDGVLATRHLRGRPEASGLIASIAREIGDRPDGASAWTNLGVVRYVRGEAGAALAAIDRAAAHRAPADLRGRLADAQERMNCLQQLDEQQAAARAGAELFALASQLRDATAPYEIAARLRDPQTHAPISRDAREARNAQIAAFLGVGFLLLELGNVERAELAYNEALALDPPRSPYAGYALALAAALADAHQFSHASRIRQQEAYAAAILAGDASLAWSALHNLVVLDLPRRDDGALEAHATATARAEAAANAAPAAARLATYPFPPSPLPADRAFAVNTKARIAMARGDQRAAIAALDAALADPACASRAMLEATLGRALRLAGDRTRAEQVLLRAAAATEQRRARLATDTFKSWLLAQQRAPFEDLFALYASTGRARDALAIAQRATARSILDALLAPPTERDDKAPTPTRAPLRGQDIADAAARFAGLRALARSLHASPAASPPALDDALARLRGLHVVTYFQAIDQLWAIVLAEDGALSIHALGAAKDIEAEAATWRSDPTVQLHSDQLGAKLLPDALLPRDGATLYVVPDRPVRELSFAALRVHGAPIVAHHAVAYGPSAAVLALVRTRRDAQRAVVLGDPTNDLPAARDEAQAVARSLQVTARLGASATKSAVLDDDAAVIHIAAHTVATPTGPALQLADGAIDASAVIEHGVRAGAIALLTCSSAAESRDELGSLANAFFAAGAHTVIASRWAVEDRVAQELAQLFYAGDGLADPARAVAAAQRVLIARGVSVAQWSTFLVTGGVARP